VKRCFHTFVPFIEGESIRESQVLDIWAGWELVPGPQAYVAAKSYLHDLEDACLIHRRHMESFSWFDLVQDGMTHDVLHDLASRIALGRSAVHHG
jgi:hypothetical protein